MKLALLSLLFVALAQARFVYKRNAYGDEQMTPAPASEAPPVVAAPEEAVHQVPAETADKGAPVEHSGYRKKREAQNSYGDEPVTEAPKPAYAPEPSAAPEQAVEQVPAETAANEAPVEHSGYRKKRGAQNAYGDEPVAAAKPAEYAADAPASPAPEQAVEQVPAETADKGAPVEHSGYRKKREAQNSYGDEPVTEAPRPAYAPEPAAAPEQAVEKVPAETSVNEAPVEKSGY